MTTGKHLESPPVSPRGSTNVSVDFDLLLKGRELARSTLEIVPPSQPALEVELPPTDLARAGNDSEGAMKATLAKTDIRSASVSPVMILDCAIQDPTIGALNRQHVEFESQLSELRQKDLQLTRATEAAQFQAAETLREQLREQRQVLVEEGVRCCCKFCASF